MRILQLIVLMILFAIGYACICIWGALGEVEINKREDR